MPRRWRRARWRRTVGRGLARGLAPAVVVALVVGLVVGGVAEIGRASGPEDKAVNLGYAALASVVAQESNASGAAVRSLVAGAPTMGRIELFSALDTLRDQIGGEARRFNRITPPSPGGRADERCRAAVAGRANGFAALRGAAEGVLGGPSGTVPMDESSALDTLQSAASTLADADVAWQSCRRTLRGLPGKARLAASAWLTDPADWAPASLGRLVVALSRAPALAARHALAVTALSTDPAALSAGGATVVPATTALTVHVIVSDQGNVDEPAVQVQVAVTPTAGSGQAATRTAIVALHAGRAKAVVLGPFTVSPGAPVHVTVTAAPTLGPGATSTSFDVQVAAVPTTTTTTTAPITTTTKPRAATTLPRATTTTGRR